MVNKKFYQNLISISISKTWLIRKQMSKPFAKVSPGECCEKYEESEEQGRHSQTQQQVGYARAAK